ncbi:hypothetical protein ACLOJK_038673, partial [Asimina triloba]
MTERSKREIAAAVRRRNPQSVSSQKFNVQFSIFGEWAKLSANLWVSTRQAQIAAQQTESPTGNPENLAHKLDYEQRARTEPRQRAHAEGPGRQLAGGELEMPSRTVSGETRGTILHEVSASINEKTNQSNNNGYKYKPRATIENTEKLRYYSE